MLDVIPNFIAGQEWIFIIIIAAIVIFGAKKIPELAKTFGKAKSEYEKGKIEGGILLRVTTMWYSDDHALEEKGIFIHPDYRSAKGGRARRMCEFAKRTAEQLGLPLLIGVLSNNRTEAKIRMYERQFGKPAGAFFLYGGHTGEPRQAAE